MNTSRKTEAQYTTARLLITFATDAVHRLFGSRDTVPRFSTMSLDKLVDKFGINRRSPKSVNVQLGLNKICSDDSFLFSISYGIALHDHHKTLKKTAPKLAQPVLCINFR